MLTEYSFARATDRWDPSHPAPWKSPGNTPSWHVATNIRACPRDPFSNLQISSILLRKWQCWNIAAENRSVSYLWWNCILFRRRKQHPSWYLKGHLVWTPNPGQWCYMSMSSDVLVHFSLMKSHRQWSTWRILMSPFKDNWERGFG